MAFRFITGESGQGKTEYVTDEVIRRSMDNPRVSYYVVVPEQFGLEMQQKIVKKHPRHGFFNIDILSFHRLAFRIFDECGVDPGRILEDLGVSMVLRSILAREEKNLSYFKRNVKKPGFIDELKSALLEFKGYGVTPAQIKEVSESLDEGSGLGTKYREIADICEHFERASEGRFIVTEQIPDIAAEYVKDAPMLRNAVFYFDGFAGFTPVQLAFLRELLKVAAEVNVTVTVPELSPTGQKAEEDLFFTGRKTEKALLALCRETGSETEEVRLSKEIPPRFLGSTELSFLAKNIFRTRPGTYENFPEHIHLTVGHNPDGETDFILHEIEKLVRQKGYRYRDFAVLCGDVAEYASAFHRKAEILDIPVFEDVKKKISYHSGVEAVRALFHLVQMDYSYESVFRYLKSGMSDFMDEETDYLENYVLSAGIRGYSMWKKPFQRRLKNTFGKSGEDRNLIREEVNRLREKMLQETEKFYLVMRDKELTVREKMTALYEEMVHLRFEEKFNVQGEKAESAGDYVKAREYGQLYELLLSLLDKIVLIFGEETIPLSELSDVVDAGLEALGLGVVPLSMDQVILGDLKRTRLHEIKVLFIAGMNDGKIPPGIEDGGILGDEDRELFAEHGILLSQNRMEQSMEDEFYMYLAFARPSREIYFSYSLTDMGGAALRPSRLQRDIRHLFPGLIRKKYPEEIGRYYFNPEDSREFLLREMVRFRDDPAHAGKSRAFRMLTKYWNSHFDRREELAGYWQTLFSTGKKSGLSETLAEMLYGRELSGTVTRLERFAACPYQYYCIYGLELREREEYKIRPVDLGNIFHRALELFSRKVKSSPYRWKDIPETAQEDYIVEALREAVDENLSDVFQSTSRNRYKIKTIHRILRRTVKVLCIHLKNSQFEPDAFELHFGKGQNDRLQTACLPLSGGRRMVLTGTVDRVDVCEDGDEILIKVIDYKSGMKKFELSDFYYGLQMQLIIYMNAAQEIYEKKEKRDGRQVVPAGVFYYYIQDPIIRADRAQESELLKNFRMSGYANGDGDILAKLEGETDGYVSVPIRLKKNGEPYKNSPVTGTEGFHAMGDYAKRKAVQTGERIYSGEISPAPCRNRRGTACDYCPFPSVCGFDAAASGYRYQECPPLSAEEIFEKIREED